jgi:hypothetical protein
MKFKNFDAYGVQAYVCEVPAYMVDKDNASMEPTEAVLVIKDADAFNRRLITYGRSPNHKSPWYYQATRKGRIYLGKTDGGSYEEFRVHKRGVMEGQCRLGYTEVYDISDTITLDLFNEGVIEFQEVPKAITSHMERGTCIATLKRMGEKAKEKS